MAGIRRKTTSPVATAAKRAKPSLDLAWKKDDDDDIPSDDDDHDDDDDGFFGRNHQADSEDSEEDQETVEAKKVRLARQYLQKIERGGDDEEDTDSEASPDEEEDDEGEPVDRIGRKLQRERQKREGTYARVLADRLAQRLDAMALAVSSELSDPQQQPTTSSRSAQQQAQDWVDAGHVSLWKGHDLTPTCVALQADGRRAVSGSKDHSVLLWDVERETSTATLWQHWKRQTDKNSNNSRTDGQVLTAACSDDGRYAAVGRRDATVSIFDLRQSASNNNLVKTFSGHKSAVTCLAFATRSHILFSGSDDRCLRHYNLQDGEFLYLETLYGHQFGVTGVDCHTKERPVSVGRDRTARSWKLAEDTHLIFRGGGKLPPADCVSVIQDDWFLTGHDDGQLCLWKADKKKPVAAVDQAHHTGVVGEGGLGIHSISSLKGSDVTVTGANDGYLRFWKVRTGETLDTRGLDPLAKVPVHGSVNDIAVGPKARFCLVAIGQEPRLGRWDRVPKAKNRLAMVKLRSETDIDDGDSNSDVDHSEEVDSYNEPPPVESPSQSDDED